MVSYQGNLEVPGFRWMKYREGFSADLIKYLIHRFQPRTILDPFSGIGTTSLVAASHGIKATGIEIVPVAMLAAQGISLASTQTLRCSFAHTAAELQRHIQSRRPPPANCYFPHVPITRAAFSADNENYIARAREFIGSVDNSEVRSLLSLACMSVLESVSFTRKDGQFLRWDGRSRKSKTQMRKHNIGELPVALDVRFREMIEDMEFLEGRFEGMGPEFILGSSLEHLRDLPAASYDMVITSPPYANRFDYTRTYALELAWLGYDSEGFKALRQKMLSATVENKSKRRWFLSSYGNEHLVESAFGIYDGQAAVQEVLSVLKTDVHALSNRYIIRMLEGYFLEMAIIVCELARLVRPGGVVAMVNDNVQYHGQELPVDLILSDFAERSGFSCKYIWQLGRGKGNSSQQMKRFGRRALRKCVYWWVRDKE